MEVILAVLQPKQNVSIHEYRPKLYNILLLDHKPTSSGEKNKPTKYLPTFPLRNTEEEPRDEVLNNLHQLTGGEHGGIKGERAILIPWNKDSPRDSLRENPRESLSKFALYCVPINKGDKLSRSFVEKSPDSPSFFSLDYMIESLNNGTVNYPLPTRTFVSQLESWLKIKHAAPGAINILFKSRADYRVKLSVNNPAFLPSRYNMSSESNGIVTNASQDELRQIANTALAKMLAIEKCEIVVINPIFGSGLPYRTKVERAVKNLYWGSGIPDYDSELLRRCSTGSSVDSFYSDKHPLHKFAAEGNKVALLECISQGYSVDERDSKSWTALHWASWYGKADVANVLMANGCTPNILNDTDQTPLHIAADMGNDNVVDVLLRYPETNLELLDKKGKTALNLCEMRERSSSHHQLIAEMLRSAINKTSQIPVLIMDGTTKMLKLTNGINTTVQQLNHQLLREFNLPDNPYAEIFTIWICSESLELQLKQEHKPVDHLKNWKRKIVGMLTDSDPTKEDPQLKWRRNAKIGLAEEREVRHNQAINILFHEAFQNYIKALYPCKDQDVHTFASILILMQQQGEYDTSSAKSYLGKNLSKLVPGPMLKAKGQSLSTQIQRHYKDFCSRLVEELRQRPQQVKQMLQMKFLDFCRNLTVYGSAFFTGTLQTTLGKGNQGSACHIGVNDIGIHIIDSKTRVVLHSFRYSEIEWNFDVSSLEIRVVKYETKTDKNLVIKIRTKQAGLIDHLMKKLAQMHATADHQVEIVYVRRNLTSM